MSNSTHHHHGHGYNPDPDTRFADEMIILGLGAVVVVTFALGLVVQLYEISIPFFRWTHHWSEEEYEYSHIMSDLETGSHRYTPSDTTKSDKTDRNSHRRWASRYGGILEHVVEANGTRKTVLVVNAPSTRDGTQDEYTDWITRWYQQQQDQTSLYGSQQTVDETAPLISGVDEEPPQVYHRSSTFAGVLRWLTSTS